VTRFVASLIRQAGRMQLTFEPAEVNGDPGAVARTPDGSIASVLSIQIADGQIVSLRSVVNPDKLAHLGPVTDLYKLMKSARA
jgi:hypothetical protein